MVYGASSVVSEGKRVIARARWRVAEVMSVSEATTRSQKRSVCRSLIWTVGQTARRQLSRGRFLEGGFYCCARDQAAPLSISVKSV